MHSTLLFKDFGLLRETISVLFKFLSIELPFYIDEMLRFQFSVISIIIVTTIQLDLRVEACSSTSFNTLTVYYRTTVQQCGQYWARLRLLL